MSTNLEFVTDALRELNVIAETDTASAEQGQHGLRKLNEMLEVWAENEIAFGYFEQTDASLDCPIPKYAEKAVKAGLAIDMAPTYGATVSPELGKKFDDSYKMLQRKFIAEQLTGQDMSNLPYGIGMRGRFNINNG